MSRSTFLAICKILVLLIVSINARYRQSCQAEGQLGTCILARNCSMLETILQQSHEQAITYLRRNHCGYEGSNPLVCCIVGNNTGVQSSPDGIETNLGIDRNPFPLPMPLIENQKNWRSCQAEGQLGTCILARNCAMVATIQRKSRDQAITYLRRNHCGFEGSNPLVCCIASNNTGVQSPLSNIETNNYIDRNLVPLPGPSDEKVSIDLANNSLLPDVCGSDLSQKIFGGERMELDEFPWMALLEYQTPHRKRMDCSGVLISKRYILTAAHCIKGLLPTWNLTSVRLGEYDTNTDIDCIKDGEDSVTCADDPISVGVEEQIAHEEYRSSSREQRYDIALLRLSHDVPFTKFIKPICLPTNSSISNKVFVAGWGTTETGWSSNVKLKLSLPLSNKEQCNQAYLAAGVSLGFGQICAGGQRGKDSCKGDSGGPLMAVERVVNGPARWTAVGVVSFGPKPCGIEGWPGVYTKVADFIPWIVSKLRP